MDVTNAQDELAEPLALWSDDPAEVDLLAFSAVASTVADAVLDDTLDPLALGLSGRWGSGKTTVLKLIEAALKASNSESAKILTISTDPWRYDPALGIKETLITEILGALRDELESQKTGKQKAIKALSRLIKRVDWARALRMAAQASLTLQLPKPADILTLARPPEEGSELEPPGLEGFRAQFRDLLATPELAHVRRLAVLVDDLDRCLPETVVETLEAIRLFLAVPKMSFVIAADEERVAEAIRTRFGQTAQPPEASESPEEPSKLYLHKIVQTTVPIPSLSRFDTEAYLVLLQLGVDLDTKGLQSYVDRCDELRRASASLDDLAEVGDADISQALLFAARLTPILYEKLRGNPRRIKRFLNDLHVRQAIAGRRGIKLAPEVVAKLMVLEVLLPTDFEKVLGWLARNELRERVASLEAAAGRADAQPEAELSDQVQASTGDGRAAPVEAVKISDDFGDDLIRWAKLSPALSSIDLGPYLHLAAAFSGEALLDAGLPVRLHDLAASLLSGARAEQKTVRDEDLRGMSAEDALALARHLGRAARDRPTQQRAAILGLLRITRIHEPTVSEASKLLRAIPVDELEPAAILTFNASDKTTFNEVLVAWQKSVSQGPVRKALDSALGSGSTH